MNVVSWDTRKLLTLTKTVHAKLFGKSIYFQNDEIYFKTMRAFLVANNDYDYDQYFLFHFNTKIYEKEQYHAKY